MFEEDAPPDKELVGDGVALSVDVPDADVDAELVAAALLLREGTVVLVPHTLAVGCAEALASAVDTAEGVAAAVTVRSALRDDVMEGDIEAADEFEAAAVLVPDIEAIGDSDVTGDTVDEFDVSAEREAKAERRADDVISGEKEAVAEEYIESVAALD